jgi:hypothetical protein
MGYDMITKHLPFLAYTPKEEGLSQGGARQL